MNDADIRPILLTVLNKVSNEVDPALAARLLDSSDDLPLSELGMDSLEGIECCMEIETLTGVELDPAELAIVDTFAGLAALVAERQREGARRKDAPVLARVPRNGPLAVSLEQEAIWDFCRSGEKGYTIPIIDRLSGPLDVAALRQSLTCIVTRHEILRTVFAEVDGQPRQFAQPAEPIALAVRQIENGSHARHEILGAIREERARVADPTRGPLIRFALFRLAENEHWLLTVCHHLLWDAHSTRLFHEEMSELHPEFVAGLEPPFPDAEELQYADFAVWQRELLARKAPDDQENIQWWKERFTGAPTSLSLPWERTKASAATNPADGFIDWPVDDALDRRLADLGRGEGASLYNMWLAAFVAVLVAETGQGDVTVGSYMTNRTLPALRNMIGYFANLVPIRCRCDLAQPFSAWLAEVRSVVTDAKAHSELPLNHLRPALEKLGAALPEIQLIFGANLAYGRESLAFGGLELTKPNIVDVSEMPWGFSLNLLELDGRKVCRAAFDAGRYDPCAVRQSIGRIPHLLQAAAHRRDLPMNELLGLAATGSTAF